MATLPKESYLEYQQSVSKKDIPNKSKSGQLYGQVKSLPKGKIDYTNEGISMATRATEEDRKKNYGEAIQLYEKSIELFTLALKNEKFSEATKSNITSKSNEYAQRAEKLKAYIRRKNSSNYTNNSGTPSNTSFVPPSSKKNVICASENSK